MSIVKYAHLRTGSSEKGGVTIVYHSESKTAPTVRYAIAECSKKDVFSKAKGRLIAEGRLNSKNSHEVVVTSHTHRSIMNEILDHIELNLKLTKLSKHITSNTNFESYEYYLEGYLTLIHESSKMKT